MLSIHHSYCDRSKTMTMRMLMFSLNIDEVELIKSIDDCINITGWIVDEISVEEGNNYLF